MRKRLVIAIDGPSGSGKSTIARLLAQELDYLYIDTGAMYRAVAWKARKEGVEPEDGEALDTLCLEVDIRLERTAQGLRTFCDGEDVSDQIRTPQMSMDASAFSAKPPVRKAMTRLQREMGKDGGIVMEGRDIGSVVFPDADFKFFLTASDQMRAARRYAELAAGANPVSFRETLEDIRKRDEDDSARALAPLIKAEDAIEVDTSGMTVDEVLRFCMEAISRGRG